MTRNEWKKKIRQNCTEVGTYKPAFDPVIDTLASMLTERDRVQSVYDDSHDKADARLLNTLNRDALAYWSQLGLTPSGLKKINEAAIKGAEKEPSALEKALAGLNHDTLGRGA